MLGQLFILENYILKVYSLGCICHETQSKCHKLPVLQNHNLYKEDVAWPLSNLMRWIQLKRKKLIYPVLVVNVKNKKLSHVLLLMHASSVMLHLSYFCCRSRQYCFTPWYSECGRQTSISCITWELIKYVDSQSDSTPDLNQSAF